MAFRQGKKKTSEEGEKGRGYARNERRADALNGRDFDSMLQKNRSGKERREQNLGDFGEKKTSPFHS